MSRPQEHVFEPIELDVTTLEDADPKVHLVGKCKTCGLPESAHGHLADHPEEARIRSQEQEASTLLNRTARKAAKALREHRRVDALVTLTQLTVMADSLRKGMHVAIDDQMKATRAQSN